MAQSTGPLLVAGAVTWANQSIFENGVDAEKAFENAVRIGVATGLLASAFFAFEKISPDIALGLAYTALVTSLVVRFNNRPTPLERLMEVAV